MTTWQHVNRDVRTLAGKFRHITVRTFPSLEAAQAYADELNAATNGKANATTSDHRVNIPIDPPAWAIVKEP